MQYEKENNLTALNMAENKGNGNSDFNKLISGAQALFIYKALQLKV